ncbi:hypothetical protein L915_10774 [Phytophthora nicotianae]|uniref:Uncharacterized protein n=1 Tax=Phytophthora nicotianae TaxID=4792 RepID=W2GPL4_PHYNI|nr:hypothetical protein L915_10774 [Phytophthora nicotianae]
MKIQFNLQYLRKEIQVGAAECIGLDCIKGVVSGPLDMCSQVLECRSRLYHPLSRLSC